MSQVEPGPDSTHDASADKLRRRIAIDAAQLVTEGQDSTRARLRAARRLAGGFVPESELPGHDEVRQEIRIAGRAASPPRDQIAAIGALVAVLETVRLDAARHPEGDLLDHSLQVFALVREGRDYDEELLSAALLHDVGYAIDRREPVPATLAAVSPLVSVRTLWFLENLPLARRLHEGTLGARARRRLVSHADFEDLIVLEEADRHGRVRGASTPTLDECLDHLRSLANDGDQSI